jgi:hypothetical protein
MAARWWNDMALSFGPATSRPWASAAAKSMPLESITATGSPVPASNSVWPSPLPDIHLPPT